MARQPRSPTVELRLPSGARVRASAPTNAASAPLAARPKTPFDDALAALERAGLADAATGRPLDVDALDVEDFHVLRAVAARLGWLDEPEIDVRCVNCEGAMRVAPALALEIAPFLDDELGDDELDEPFDFSADHPIPAVRLASGSATTLRLERTTVGASRPFWEALARPELRLSSRVVRGMGVVALGGETRAAVVARALSRASDDAFDAVGSLVDAARYAPRMRAAVRCEACGAATFVDAPAVRELGVDASREGVAESADEVGGFPDAERFEQLVRRVAPAAFEARRVLPGDVALVVDDGVPWVDDAGTPLFGCFSPGGLDEGGVVDDVGEIRLFHRTFRAVWRDEGPYDLEAEIVETLDHELEHATNEARGHDPLDDEERETLAREAVRRTGRRETARRARAAFAGNLGDFLRRTWPVWVALLVAAWLATLGGGDAP